MDPIEALLARQVGQRVFLDQDVRSGYTVVPVSKAPVKNYVEFVRQAISLGVPAFILSALGHKWIAKTHQVIDQLVQSGTANVLTCEVGTERFEHRPVPVIVATILAAPVLHETDAAIWSKEEIGRWQFRADLYKSTRQCNTDIFRDSSSMTANAVRPRRSESADATNAVVGLALRKLARGAVSGEYGRVGRPEPRNPKLQTKQETRHLA